MYLPSLYQLQLVCKRLHSAFKRENRLKRDVVILANKRSLDNIIPWAEQHHEAIQNVVALPMIGSPLDQTWLISNPFTEMILVTLHVKRACLLSAHIDALLI